MQEEEGEEGEKEEEVEVMQVWQDITFECSSAWSPSQFNIAANNGAAGLSQH